MANFPLIPASGFQKTLIQEFNTDSSQDPFEVILPNTDYNLILIEFCPLVGVEGDNLYCAFDPKQDVVTLPGGQYSQPRGVLCFYGFGQNFFFLIRSYSYSSSTRTISFYRGAQYHGNTGYKINNTYCVVKRIWGVT